MKVGGRRHAPANPPGTPAGTLKVSRNAYGKLPDTPASTPGGFGRRRRVVLDSVSWMLPVDVSS